MSKSIRNLPLIIFAAILSFGLVQTLSAQSNRNIVSFNFDPKVDGFKFPNYKNEGNKWQDDLGDEDLGKMFGIETLCKKRDRNNQCIDKLDTEKWLDKYKKAMNIGHCEGIAVASLRMNSNLPFKGKSLPAQFQTGANSVYGLPRNQTLENYIAYYWITQSFKEIGRAHV